MYMRLSLRILGLGLVALLCPLIALADTSTQVTVDGVQRYFRVGERPVQTITVTNTSKDKVLVLDSVLKEYEDVHAKVLKLKDTDDFLVSPKKFTIKPGEKRLVRVVLSKPMNDKERYYNIVFQPDYDAMKNEENKEGGGDDLQMGISYVVTSGVILLVSPQNPKEKLTWTRNDEGITFKNEGNISVDMKKRTKYCFDAEGKDCTMLIPQRIHPGKEWFYPISSDRKLQYYYAVYDRVREPVNIAPLY